MITPGVARSVVMSRQGRTWTVDITDDGGS
jgi:hypothetical protein